MKKITIFLSAFVLCLVFLSGCNGNKQTQSYFDKEEIKTLSIGYCEQMSQGDFQGVYNAFIEKNKSSVSLDQLTDSWKTNVSSCAPYTRVVQTTYSLNENNRTATVTVVLEFNGVGKQVLFAYNTDKKLESLFFSNYFLTPALVDNRLLEEQEQQVGEGEYPLYGILTLPKQSNSNQVVLFVHGSGPNDLNESIDHNKVFEEMARKLAEQGIASLRYNKRYYQYPEAGNKEPMTVEREVLEDVTSAIQSIKTNPKVKDKQLVVIGHSLGGMLSFKIATDNKEVTAIASLAGSPRHLADIIYSQTVAALPASYPTASKETLETLLEQTKGQIELAKNVPEENKDSILPLLGVTQSYWYSYNQIDIPVLAKELDIPIFIAQGSADFQITKADYKAWENTLVGKDNVSFHWYEDLNHIFMKTNGKKDSTEYDKVGALDTAFIKDLCGFIKGV